MELRCAYCHGPVAGERGYRCCLCETVLHPDCWAESRTCPTLGCDRHTLVPTAAKPKFARLAYVLALAVAVCATWGATLWRPDPVSRTDRIAAQGFYRHGMVLQEEGDCRGAKQAFTKALARNPFAVEAWSARSQARRCLLDLHGAISDTREAVLLAPDSAPARAAHDRAVIDLEAFYFALDEYAERLELRPCEDLPGIEEIWAAHLAETQRLRPSPQEGTKRRSHEARRTRGEGRAEARELSGEWPAAD